ncbi:hypothetical protein LIER_12112 [Lithospermum erythrorhizon]|uniref:Uncharacterized protein n=1 Tax=Lithospermum erythrorhizon TaxID=34254 RepID=A0AAV3PQG9_LITER
MQRIAALKHTNYSGLENGAMTRRRTMMRWFEYGHSLMTDPPVGYLASSESLAPTEKLLRVRPRDVCLLFLWYRHLKEPGCVVGEQRQLILPACFRRGLLGDEGIDNDIASVDAAAAVFLPDSKGNFGIPILDFFRSSSNFCSSSIS